MGITEYRNKRDFSRTPEPEGNQTEGGGNLYVVQKHDSSNLHYDLRLEVRDALKSWAIPLGPSLDPSEKRLAMATEDHPVEYAEFEGEIPQGEYGAGKVIVWDKGTYTNNSTNEGEKISMTQAYENGEITFELTGKKLKGEFALVKMKGRKNQWLLIKIKDKYADARKNPISSKPESVISGKKLKEVQANV